MKKLMKSVLACALAFAMVLTVMPVNSYAASNKKVVVTSQKQLEKALKSGATNIVIKTDKKIKITIPASKKAEKVSISVQAKNATITNNATVKSIVIKDAKAFVESGKNNDIKITDDNLSLIVAKTSTGSDISVAKKDAAITVVAKGDVASVTVAKTANVTLTVNKNATVDSVNVAAKGASVDLNAKGTVSDVKVSEKAADTKLNINASGKVENVQIDAKADVAVAGSTTEAVKVTVNAKDTTIKAKTAIDTTLNADTKLDLSKGAEGSTVTTGENVKADVANNTTDKVSVKDSTGKETTVDAGKTETKTDDGKKDDQKTDDNPGTVTPAPTPTPTPDPTPSEPEIEFSKLWIEDKNLISVYFSGIEEVAEHFDISNIEIKDAQGVALGVRTVEKSGNGYYITLDSDMTDQEYQFNINYAGKEYQTSFTYDSDKMNYLKQTVTSLKDACMGEDVVVTASESALEVSGLLEDALIAYLDDKVHTEANFEVSLDEVSKRDTVSKTITALMIIDLTDYNSETGTDFYYGIDFEVDLIFNIYKFTAKEPEIKQITKTSVAIQAEDYYEYACVDANTSIENIAENQWVSDTDNCGNAVINGLTAGKNYKVYARYDGSSLLYATKNIEIPMDAPEVICIAESADGKMNIDLGEVTTGSAIRFMLKVKTADYGNTNRKGLHGNLEAEKIDDKEETEVKYAALPDQEWDADDEDWYPIVEFQLPDEIGKGSHSVTFKYYFEYSEVDELGYPIEDKDPIVQSAPLKYTVTFIVK